MADSSDSQSKGKGRPLCTTSLTNRDLYLYLVHRFIIRILVGSRRIGHVTNILQLKWKQLR